MVTRNNGFRCRIIRSAVYFGLATFAIALNPHVGVVFGQKQPAAQVEASAFPVSIRADATKVRGEMRPVWRYFGYDEPNYTYMKDGQKLLSQFEALSPGTVFIRTHNLLTSGDGTPALKWGSTGVYTEDDQGRPQYDWTILDHIFDTYLEQGVRPYVQIGFMPEALSTHPKPYQHEWTPGRAEIDLDRLGLPAQGLQEVGRAGFPVGQALRRALRQDRGRDVGTGRSGTSPTSSTGGGRPRSTTSSMTSPSTP